MKSTPLPARPARPVIKRRRSTQGVIETIVRDLEEDIVLGVLHPRERLVEDTLIVRFEATRYAVREALSRLEQLSLVERLANCGAMVRAPKPSEVEEIYGIRENLEAAASREVLRLATAEDIDRIIEAQHQHDTAVKHRDPKSVFRTNTAFHRAFFSTCGNRELLGIIEIFAKKAPAVQSVAISRPQYFKRAQAEHWTIIEALRDKREQELLRICCEHIRDEKDRYMEVSRRWLPA